MQLRQDYPYDEALDDLETFIDKCVIHQHVKDEFREIFDSARQQKTVPMRGIHKKFINYVEEHKLYDPYTEEDKETIDDLIHFWC